ncbi:MAG: ATP-dependent DNA helicase RecG [Actinomycetota bacterium]
MMADPLDTPLRRAGIQGLTPKSAQALERKGVRTVRDLLEQTPRRWVDLSHTKTIAELKIGEEATILGTVHSITSRYIPRSRKHMVTLRIADGTGFVEKIWWNQPYREKQYAKGDHVAVAGKIERRSGKLQVSASAVVEKVPEDDGPRSESPHTGRIIPVHPATEGVTPTMMRRFVFSALRKYKSAITDPLPEEVLDKLDLLDRVRALEQIHFPPTLSVRSNARKRLAFEELFVLSSGLALRKRRIERETKGIEQSKGTDEVQMFLQSLPYQPTNAQRRSIDEIAHDMARPIPMHRLLQGEVGSGKTLVAVAAAVIASANGMQTALMAPTEVLAEQHFLSITRMLEGAAPTSMIRAVEGQMSFEAPGFGVELLTGSVTGKQRERVLDSIKRGASHLVIGTHALIQENVEFAQLGLAVIDEQHRFGVHQRIALRGKGPHESQPDVLIMTATPIPRTLALTLYGDLDTSVLDEMPPGRTPIETIVFKPEQRDEAEALLAAAAERHQQSFVVCPLVEQSDKLEAKAAQSEYERIATEFPSLRVALIHGRMKPVEKEDVMRRMRAAEIDVLVATTVIEVGVDIPNASVMIIEDADRFGLSQLHQLRGRIGRGPHASTCVLMSSLDDEDEMTREIARKRLTAMEQTNDGFKLAEVDLELRGEGQIFGRGKLDSDPKAAHAAPLQAGANDLRFASLLYDQELLLKARAEAFAIVDRDPHLIAHEPLLAEVRRRFADRLDWLFVG